MKTGSVLAVVTPLNGEFGSIAAGGAEALGCMDPYELLGALRDIANPWLLAREALLLLVEWTWIAAGVGDRQLPEKDRRFSDPTWRDNPLYNRWARAYLAWCESVDRLVDDADVDERERSRARYATNILTALAAPTNLLPGNPAALKRAFETGGVSLLRGARNFINDLIFNGGMPTQVDTSGFTVGENLAATAGAVVHREDMFELLQYAPTTPTVYSRPLLMVPPQVNKHYFLDLAPGRSLVEYTIAQGILFFTIVWRNPRREHGGWTMADYVAAQLRALDIVREISGTEDVNVLGACAGGLTTALMLGYLGASGRSGVHAAAFMITVIDTSEPSLIQALSTDRVRRQLSKDAAAKRIYDKTMASNFAWMRPNDLVFNYMVNNWLMGNDPPAFDILAWNADSTNSAAAFDRDLIELYATNAAATPGALTVLDTPIDLSGVNCDNYIVAGRTDHITPWKPCYLTSHLLGGPSEVVLTSTGHIQTIVNPPGKPRASYHVGPASGPDADAWLAGATRHDGSWWPHWAQWLTARSGELVPAPESLGSPDHPAGDPAPGRYVLEK
jgi:polyhydroxyalkanoate synthase subunit PhaC